MGEANAATLKIAIAEKRAKYTTKGDEKEWPIGLIGALQRICVHSYGCLRSFICYQYRSNSLAFQIGGESICGCNNASAEQSESSPIYVIAFLWISRR
jgi:hypothetical protein